MQTSRSGRLYVVATPIGNLDDLAPRAVAVLGAVAVIACEDTRTSGTLLQRFGIATPTVPLHEHNERAIAERLVARLVAGEDVALISDAGTPLVSDPGFRLVRAAREAGIATHPVPGPCAAVAALSVAGLPSDRFVFEGFLPAKDGARRARLAELAAETRTLVFYEAKHRILDTLRDLAAVFGGTREATLARELTKLHETVLSDGLAALAARLEGDPEQRLGEFVLVVAGRAATDAEAERLAEGARVFRLLVEALPASRAAKLAASITGAPKNALYRLIDGDAGDGGA